MNTVRVHAVLLDAEGPQIIVLRDDVESSWLGTAVDRTVEGDEFLCVPISPGRLAQFRHGDVDLRSIFAMPQVASPATIVIPAHSNGKRFDLVPITDIPQDWLPDEGFLLTEFVEPVASEFREMSGEASIENRPIVYLNLNPPEAKEEHVIDSDRLGRALLLFQTGLRHASTLANRSLSFEERKLLSGPENYTFEVFGFAPNSFEVHMKAKASGDLFGHTPHVRALRKLDEIAAVVENTEAAIEVAKANRGHFVSAITALLHFVANGETALSYAWTEPQSGTIRYHTIRPAPAEVLYQALIQKQELTRQELSFVGVFRKIDEESGAWRLETPEGEDHAGTVAKESGVTLHGITIGAKVYAVKCLERLLETAGTGRTTPHLEIVAPPIEIPVALPPASPQGRVSGA